MSLRIGTRKSRLSVAQTGWVAEQLRRSNPGHDFAVRTMTTRGDTDPRPLFAIDQKGIFAKEIDRAVMAGEVDFAVHSLKDVPSEIPGGLVLASVPRREQVNDVLVSKDGGSLDGMAAGSTVGTSSLRRAVQISIKRPDIRVRPIRGNIETRIRRSQDGTLDAVVLAKAGISRLGVDVRHAVLPTADFMPSPGQGALALVCRDGDRGTLSVLQSIEDPDSRLGIEAERALSEAVGSGCRFPVGAHGQIRDGRLVLRASAFSVDGQKSIFVEKSGPKEDAQKIGRDAGEELQNRGVRQLALNWREKVDEWNRR